MTQFNRLKTLYEKQIVEKNNEHGNQITLHIVGFSINDAKLKSLIAAVFVPDSNVDGITEELSQKCVNSHLLETLMV